MKILAMKRRHGKTTELIRKSNKEWKYIICRDRERLKQIVSMADKMNLNIPFPITAKELPLRGRYIDKVLVDDINDVMEYLVGKPISVATTSCKIKKKL